MADVLNRAGATWNPRLLANLYAAAALAADDAHAAERGLLTQHFGIVRADLLAVVDLAARAVDGQHASPGRLHNDCAECAAVFALGRVRNAVEWIDAPTGQSRR